MDCPFMRYKNIAGRFFRLVTKHARDGRTDRLTDRQNYDSQDRASIAASRGETVCHMLSVRCLTVLSVCMSCPVCDVGVLWPNGWMDEDKTWQGGMATVTATMC